MFDLSDAEWMELKEKKDMQMETKKKKTILSYPDGRIIYVRTGMIYLYTENEQAERQIIQLYRPGSLFFTDMLPDVADGVSYYYVKYEAQILVFRKKDLLSITSFKPDRFLALYEEMICDLLEIGFSLRQKTLQEKLLHFFRKEQKLQHSETITIPIPYCDLAEHLGVDRSALMKEIKHMHTAGLISGSGRTVTPARTDIR